MNRRHAKALPLAMRVALATAWAGLLVLAGLWALTVGRARYAALEPAWLLGGLTVIAMGQFVFSALVADRLFPHADPRVVLAFQALTGLAFVLGFALLLLWWLGGTTLLAAHEPPTMPPPAQTPAGR